MMKLPVLVPNWRKAHRMLSVQLAAVLGVLSFLQDQVLPLYQFAIPPRYWPWVSAGFATAIAIGRVIRQPSVSGAGAADAGADSDTKAAP